MTTFVTVGNGTQSFCRLLNAVSSIAFSLPQPVIVQHGNTPFSCPGSNAVQFMEMKQFGIRMEEAELLIMHAGAGSVIHAVQAGKTPVVMPRRVKYDEIVDDHQLEFAQALAQAGKVVLALEPADLEQAIADALARQSDSHAPPTSPQMVRLVEERLQDYAKQFNK